MHDSHAHFQEYIPIHKIRIFFKIWKIIFYFKIKLRHFMIPPSFPTVSLYLSILTELFLDCLLPFFPSWVFYNLKISNLKENSHILTYMLLAHQLIDLLSLILTHDACTHTNSSESMWSISSSNWNLLNIILCQEYFMKYIL